MDRIRHPYPACKTAKPTVSYEHPAGDSSRLLFLCLGTPVQPCLAARKHARTGSHLREPGPRRTSRPEPPAAEQGDGVAAWRGRRWHRTRAGGTAAAAWRGLDEGVLTPVVRAFKSLLEQPVTPAARQRWISPYPLPEGIMFPAGVQAFCHNMI